MQYKTVTIDNLFPISFKFLKTSKNPLYYPLDHLLLEADTQSVKSEYNNMCKTDGALFHEW